MCISPGNGIEHRCAASLPAVSHPGHHQGFGLTFPPRFRGSYFHLHGGYLPDALVDLTGGAVTSINLHSPTSDLVMMVKTAARAGSLMACTTPGGVSRTKKIPLNWFKPGPFGWGGEWPSGQGALLLRFTEVMSSNLHDSPPSETGIAGFIYRRGNGLREAT